MNDKRKICFEDAKRIVVKIGSGVLTEDNGLNISFDSRDRHLLEVFAQLFYYIVQKTFRIP